jgi:hypothetical protein
LSSIRQANQHHVKPADESAGQPLDRVFERYRIHLLGVAEHGRRLLDHLEVDVKHNETSHFTALLVALTWGREVHSRGT